MQTGFAWNIGDRSWDLLSRAWIEGYRAGNVQEAESLVFSKWLDVGRRREHLKAIEKAEDIMQILVNYQ